MSPERTTTASSRRDRFAVLSSAMTRLLHNLTYTTSLISTPQVVHMWLNPHSGHGRLRARGSGSCRPGPAETRRFEAG